MPTRRALLSATAGVLALGVGGTAVLASRESQRYSDYAAALRAPLDGSGMAGFIRYACLAANGHNTQPWLFSIKGNTIDIVPDVERRTPVVDPDDHHLYVSLGCALENLLLAIENRGLSTTVNLLDQGAGGVSVVLEDTSAAIDPLDQALFAAIPFRQSTRSVYSGAAVSTERLATLGRASRINGVSLSLLTDRARIDLVRDLVIEGNNRQMDDPAFVRELLHWLRFSPSHAMSAGDGLYSATTGNPSLPEWLGPLAFRLAFTKSGEADKYARQMDSSAGVAVLAAEQADPAGWISVGRSCQRFCLAATALGLKTAFVNQPLEVAELRLALAEMARLRGLRPDVVLRFGYADVLPFSPRRPVADVIRT
ncbi:nitroreductase family protein [Ciceribacter sp. L1K23]|nr:nitroreductase family protein [Ciceribacter sp. L1K23]